MSRCVGEFQLGETRSQGVRGQVMQSVLINLQVVKPVSAMSF
jgi:hypothetical protein